MSSVPSPITLTKSNVNKVTLSEKLRRYSTGSSIFSISTASLKKPEPDMSVKGGPSTLSGPASVRESKFPKTGEWHSIFSKCTLPEAHDIFIHQAKYYLYKKRLKQTKFVNNIVGSSVSDGGEGITDENVDTFEEFLYKQRVDVVTSNAWGGFGLPSNEKHLKLWDLNEMLKKLNEVERERYRRFDEAVREFGKDGSGEGGMETVSLFWTALHVLYTHNVPSKTEAYKLIREFLGSVPPLEHIRAPFLKSTAMKDCVTKICIAVFTYVLLCFECRSPPGLGSLSWSYGAKRDDLNKKRQIVKNDEWKLKNEMGMAWAHLLLEAARADAVIGLEERKRLFEKVGGMSFHLTFAEFMKVYAPAKEEQTISTYDKAHRFFPYDVEVTPKAPPSNLYAWFTMLTKREPVYNSYASSFETIRRIAIYGASGIGKTQFALHYAQTTLLANSTINAIPISVYFITASREEYLVASILKIFEESKIVDKSLQQQLHPGADYMVVANAWKKYLLLEGKRWVIIIDDVTKDGFREGWVEKYLPYSGRSKEQVIKVGEVVRAVIYTTTSGEVADGLCPNWTLKMPASTMEEATGVPTDSSLAPEITTLKDTCKRYWVSLIQAHGAESPVVNLLRLVSFFHCNGIPIKALALGKTSPESKVAEYGIKLDKDEVLDATISEVGASVMKLISHHGECKADRNSVLRLHANINFHLPHLAPASAASGSDYSAEELSIEKSLQEIILSGMSNQMKATWARRAATVLSNIMYRISAKGDREKCTATRGPYLQYAEPSKAILQHRLIPHAISTLGQFKSRIVPFRGTSDLSNLLFQPTIYLTYQLGRYFFAIGKLETALKYFGFACDEFMAAPVGTLSEWTTSWKLFHAAVHIWRCETEVEMQSLWYEEAVGFTCEKAKWITQLERIRADLKEVDVYITGMERCILRGDRRWKDMNMVELRDTELGERVKWLADVHSVFQNYPYHAGIVPDNIVRLAYQTQSSLRHFPHLITPEEILSLLRSIITTSTTYTHQQIRPRTTTKAPVPSETHSALNNTLTSHLLTILKDYLLRPSTPHALTHNPTLNLLTSLATTIHLSTPRSPIAYPLLCTVGSNKTTLYGDPGWPGDMYLLSQVKEARKDLLGIVDENYEAWEGKKGWERRCREAERGLELKRRREAEEKKRREEEEALRAESGGDADAGCGGGCGGCGG